MAYDKVVDSAKLDAGMTATANAIRAKTGGTGKISWNSDTGFKTAVEEIQTGGGTEDLSAELAAQDVLISQLEEAVASKASGGGGGTTEPPNIQPLSVTENGTYAASGDVDGYSPIVVAVPEKVPVLQPLTVTENGTYPVPESADGYGTVTVNVQEDEPVLEPLNVTENGTYTPSGNADGFSKVTVNVPTSGGGSSGEDIELCKVTVEHNVINGAVPLWVVAYTTVINDEITSVAIEFPSTGTHTYNCIKGSIVTVLTQDAFYATCTGSAENLIEASYGIFRITGDATISAESMD